MSSSKNVSGQAKSHCQETSLHFMGCNEDSADNVTHVLSPKECHI